MSREIVIEDAVVAAFEDAGWLQRKVIFAGRKGAPDRWFLRKGMWVLIEFKKPGEKPDGIQQREHQRLLEHGQKVYVIDSIKHGLDMCLLATEASNIRAQ